MDSGLNAPDMVDRRRGEVPLTSENVLEETRYMTRTYQTFTAALLNPR